MSNVFGFVDKSPYWLYNNTPTAEYVTTDTDQTITGLKTIDNNLICNYTLYCSALNASSAIISPSLTTSFVYFPDGSTQTSAFPTSINVSSDNVNQFNYLTYVKTASTGTKQVYIDDVSPVNLRYNPFSGELQASNYTFGNPASTQNGTLKFATGIYQLSNSAPSGSYTFTCKDPRGDPDVALRISSSQTITYGTFNLNSTDSTVRQIYNTFYNFMDLDTNIGGQFRGRMYADNSYVYLAMNSGHRFMIAIGSSAGANVFEIDSTGANFTVSPSCSILPTSGNMLCNKTYVDSVVPLLTDYVTTNTSQSISGQKTFTTHTAFCTATMPASNNSSTIIPTTAWVQSAINLKIPFVTYEFYSTVINQNVVTTFIPPAGGRSVYFIFSGGGGGGGTAFNAGSYGPGGGAGGCAQTKTYTLLADAANCDLYFQITVGAGGSSGLYNVQSDPGTNGKNTIIQTYLAGAIVDTFTAGAGTGGYMLMGSPVAGQGGGISGSACVFVNNGNNGSANGSTTVGPRSVNHSLIGPVTDIVRKDSSGGRGVLYSGSPPLIEVNGSSGYVKAVVGF